MVFINEWLPNPAGSDAAGEFVELFNKGASATDLSGWRLATENGKQFPLDGYEILPQGYLVLRKSTTKLTLRNSDGAVSLYAPGGALADRAEFRGAAPEGKSFSRANYDAGPETHFAWTVSTPGAANALPAAPSIERFAPAYGAPIGPQFTAADFFAIMIGVAALVSGIIFYVVKKHEDLAELFSLRDRAVWDDARGEGEGGDGAASG